MGQKTSEATRKIKRSSYLIFGSWFLVVVIIFGIIFFMRYQQVFSTQKWLADPEQRTKIVDDLLARYDLTGMTADEITALLGDNSNDHGYFVADNRYVYYLGAERGLISIDSEWLIIDFADGVAVQCFITRD